MKKELQEQWTAELRSGRYQQGTEYLCHDGMFCCLGVLASIYNRGRPLEEQQPMGEQVLEGYVAEAAGLSSGCGEIASLTEYNNNISLASLNDGVWVRNDYAKRLREMSKTLAKVKPDVNEARRPSHARPGTGEFWKLDFNQIADLIDELGDQL